MAGSSSKVPQNRSRSDEIKKNTGWWVSHPKTFLFTKRFFFQPLQKFNWGNVQFFYAFEVRGDETTELTLLNS